MWAKWRRFSMALILIRSISSLELALSMTLVDLRFSL